MKRAIFTPEQVLKIRTVVIEAARLCRKLDDDGRMGEVQRRCIREDIRTRRHLRNLAQRATRIARQLDEYIYED